VYIGGSESNYWLRKGNIVQFRLVNAGNETVMYRDSDWRFDVKENFTWQTVMSVRDTGVWKSLSPGDSVLYKWDTSAEPGTPGQGDVLMSGTPITETKHYRLVVRVEREDGTWQDVYEAFYLVVQ
jgi:hypothetical protein